MKSVQFNFTDLNRMWFIYGLHFSIELSADKDIRNKLVNC